MHCQFRNADVFYDIRSDVSDLVFQQKPEGCGKKQQALGAQKSNIIVQVTDGPEDGNKIVYSMHLDTEEVKHLRGPNRPKIRNIIELKDLQNKILVRV